MDTRSLPSVCGSSRTANITRFALWIVFLANAGAATFGHTPFNPIQVGAACYVLYIIVCVNERSPSPIGDEWGARLSIICLLALFAIGSIAWQGLHLSIFEKRVRTLCESAVDNSAVQQKCDEIQSLINDYVAKRGNSNY